MRGSVPPTLRLFRRIRVLPYGTRLFTFGVCRKAPYFGSIRPHVTSLEPGRAEVSMRKRRAVLNHIGTVHAIACCNLAELALGMVAEATVAATHRWIPKSMSVVYLRRAETDLVAVATMGAQAGAPATFSDTAPGAGAEIPVDIAVSDLSGNVVVRVVITIWVTPKPATGRLSRA